MPGTSGVTLVDPLDSDESAAWLSAGFCVSDHAYAKVGCWMHASLTDATSRVNASKGALETAFAEVGGRTPAGPVARTPAKGGPQAAVLMVPCTGADCSRVSSVATTLNT